MNIRTTRQQRMKKVWIVIPFYLFTFLPLSAQTFTQRIQTPVKGQGTVTIHEDATIDALVNSAQLNTAKAGVTPAASSKPSGKPATATNSSTPSATAPKTGTVSTLTSATHTEAEKAEETVDTSKKVMKGGYKVNGYRVQVFAGGNSRKDRQQAERAGNAVKAQFGNVPVYVHFYSPRWICRVGNYRTYEEAHQMLSSIRKMGYTQATIVKGKITVQD